MSIMSIVKIGLIVFFITWVLLIFYLFNIHIQQYKDLSNRVIAESNTLLLHTLYDNHPADITNEDRETIELMSMLDENRYINNETKESVVSLVQFWASHYELAPRLVMSIILVESSGNPSAVSNRAAKGLMQVTKLHSRALDSYSIENNIMIGTTYLAYLIRSYGKDGGIKRYFCGESNKSCLGSRSANDYLSKVTVVYDM